MGRPSQQISRLVSEREEAFAGHIRLWKQQGPHGAEARLVESGGELLGLRPTIKAHIERTALQRATSRRKPVSATRNLPRCAEPDET
jgi:hypothetical protein